MAPNALHLCFVAFAAACGSAAAATTTAAQTAAAAETEIPSLPVIQPLPPLPSLPPVDLSSDGVETLLAHMRSALTSPVVKEIDQPLTSLLTRLTELLTSLKGKTLPAKAEQQATKLTESLRSVFAQQSILREKLGALQLVAKEQKQPDVEGIKSAAEKLVEQYGKLQTMGEETFAALKELMQAMFPILKNEEALSAKETPEGVIRAVRSMFPDILS